MRPLPRPRSVPVKLPMMTGALDEEREDDDWKFFPEAFQAWRAWVVVDWDGVIMLRSITYQTKWIPCQELIAECLPFGGRVKEVHNHPSPDLEHGCGIYSVKDPEDAKRWVRHPKPEHVVVYGRASIWGHCYNFTRGYLSEFAYPSYLIVPTWRWEEGKKPDLDIHPEDLAMELSKTYRVEAVIE